MDSKIKFSIEGLQTLRDEMAKVYRESVAQSKLLLDSNKEFVVVLQSQIKLLQERRDLLGPPPSSTASNPSNNQYLPPTVTGTVTGLNNPGSDQPITRTQSEIKRTVRELSQAILDQKKLVDGTKEYIKDQKQLLEGTSDPRKRKGIQSEIDAAKLALRQDQGDLKELQRQREQARLNPGTSPNQQGPNLRPSMIQGLGTAMLINPLNSQDPVQGAVGMGQNLSSMMMMAGGKMGWVGLGLGLGVGIAGAQVQLLKDVMPAAARMSRLTGSGINSFLERNNEFSELGYTRSQVLENRAAALKALGQDSSSNLSTMLALQKGFDVSQGDLTGLMRAGRGDKNFDLQRVFSNTYAGLQYAGLGKQKTEAFIPEYLKILTELGQKQLETLGKVDYGVNTRVLSVISGAGERLQNPDTARGVLNKLYQGLTSAQTPQVEALQFQALSKAFPGKSLLGLEMIREEPFSKDGMKYTEAMMQNIKNYSVSKDDRIRNISNIFGTNLNLSAELSNLFDKPGGIFDVQKKLEENKGITEQEVYKRALGAADKFDVLLAKWENVKWGEATTDLINILDKTSSILNKVDKALSAADKVGVGASDIMKYQLGIFSPGIAIKEISNKIFK